ncbi:hypothetical protein FE840_016580 [Peteryoungia desertarenae]|uniref:Uncharacterized protein n=1 Tax=Peteryoungia desertarenae TaxID=1813451 RepID=A0ABX6QRA8_9HYPH|nr:hypothetical protein [Peteryoungia desertarenae]QLF71034.1 hypothetical protein FE840_016580 [Peteryoungia desertarenae]
MSGFFTRGALAALLALLGGSASANGIGEDRPFQFRSANERQVLLNLERTRLEQKSGLGVGSAAGLGTQQTGNSTSIIISGSGNNTITTSQTNSGAQTILESNDSSVLNNN